MNTCSMCLSASWCFWGNCVIVEPVGELYYTEVHVLGQVVLLEAKDFDLRTFENFSSE